MLYLLLDEQKKAIRSEYRLRFVAVFCALLSVVLFLWIVTVIPSFARVQIEKSALGPQQDLVAQIRFFEDGSSYEEYVRNINQKTLLLEAPEYPVSELIREVTGRQIRSVQLNVIEFVASVPVEGSSKKDAISSAQIRLSGIANNRESLAEFSGALEESEHFASVDVPFSSFARSTEIPFTLTVVVKNIEE